MKSHYDFSHARKNPYARTMKEKSAQRGKRTSAAEVLGISSNGLWLLVDHREYFLAFTVFPWIMRAPVSQVFNVERPTVGHLYWPELDVDIAVESMEHPERFPLVCKERTDYRSHRTAGARAGGRNGKPTSARRR
jgi:hypothetical protein